MKALLSFIFLLISYGSLAQSFIWAKQVGGNSSDAANAIAQDNQGNIYVTGTFIGTVDFDPGPATYNLSSSTSAAFILNLDNNGNFIWAKQIETTAAAVSEGMGITLDANGNIYLTGSFHGFVDFDPGPGAFTLAPDTDEIFILKLDINGNFIWVKELGRATSLGGQGRGNSIITDQAGNIFIAGRYYGSGDFDPGPGQLILGTSSASAFVFMCKLDINGNLTWAKATEGGVFSQNISMTIDGSSNMYITGGFSGLTDFDPGPATFPINTGFGFSSIFIFKLDNQGNFQWAKVMAGGLAFGASLVTDSQGNVYSTGKFAGTVDFDPGAGVYNLNYTGTADIYVLKLNTNGGFVFAKQLGGNNDAEGTAIRLDLSGNIYVTGIFSGTVDFDPDATMYELTATGSSDMFVCRLGPSGTLTWAARMGGTTATRPSAITLNAQGNIFTCGSFSGSTDFDFSSGNAVFTSNGNMDVFIHNIGHCVNSVPYIITASACSSYTLNNQVYTVSGQYTQTIPNMAGCDSSIVLNLTIGTQKKSVSISACGSYSWNNQLYTQSGTFIDTLTGMNGCDSIINLKLTITEPVFITVDKTICRGDVYEGHTLPGTYTGIFTSAAGCDSTRTLHLTVRSNCIPFAIPNAFSPDADGINDIFRPIITENMSAYSFSIFNRNGRKLFETRMYPSGWDGTWQGRQQPPGTYVYYISYIRDNGWQVEEKGSFLLLR